MDRERMAKMAERIADEEKNDENLMIVDQAIDSIIAAVATLDETLPNVATDNDKEKKAIQEIRDLLETAIAPYMGDIIKALEAFEE
jgi:hypothetical protein